LELTSIGLNGLKGFNVTGVRLNSSAKAGEPNLKGFAYIPNPSVITVALVCTPSNLSSWKILIMSQGNVTLTLSTTKAGVVGNTTINDMTLVPGNNTLPMTGIVDQVLIASSLNSTGWVTLSIKGESAIYNGQHLTYYVRYLPQIPLNHFQS
jgi:hypothetical protein